MTALFFTTESVFLRGQLVESDAQRLASEVIEAALEAKSAALVLDSPAAAEYASQIVIQEVRSITRPRARLVPFEFHLEFVSLSAASALSSGFVYPDAFTERDTPNPEVWVRESLVDCGYQLEIIDNAGGIDAKYLDRVFEPFYTTKVKAARSGLGLAIAWRLVDSIGGEIHGENVDGGTCLRIQLPLVAALGTSESPREE